jgi:hypothetical protein
MKQSIQPIPRAGSSASIKWSQPVTKSATVKQGKAKQARQAMINNIVCEGSQAMTSDLIQRTEEFNFATDVEPGGRIGKYAAGGHVPDTQKVRQKSRVPWRDQNRLKVGQAALHIAGEQCVIKKVTQAAARQNSQSLHAVGPMSP